MLGTSLVCEFTQFMSIVEEKEKALTLVPVKKELKERAVTVTRAEATAESAPPTC